MVAVIAIVLTVVVVAVIVASAIPPLPRWPKPAPREHECFECRVSYAQAWQLSNHNHFMHPQPDLEAGKAGITVRPS